MSGRCRPVPDKSQRRRLGLRDFIASVLGDTPPNNRLQRTALRAATEPER